MNSIHSLKVSQKENYIFRKHKSYLFSNAEYFLKLNLKYVRIYFDATTIDLILKDRAAK